MPDLVKLRHVLAVQHFGSLAKAARALSVSEPTLSKSISRLEDRLQVKLFERTARGSELTAAGELVAERAALVVSQADSMVRDLALMSGGEAGKVRLGVTTVFGDRFPQRLISAVAGDYPRLRVHFEPDQSCHLSRLLTLRHLDMVIDLRDPSLDPELFEFVEIGQFEVVVVAGAGHALAGPAPVTLEALAEHKLIACIGEHSDAARLDLLGRDIPAFYTSPSSTAVTPLVLQGEAVMLAPRPAVQPLIDQGAFVELTLAFSIRPIVYGASIARHVSQAPVLRKIVANAREVARALLSETEAERR